MGLFKKLFGDAVDEMKKDGYLGTDTEVTIDYYYNSSSDDKLHYIDTTKEKIASADATIAFSYASGSSALDKENAQFIALHSAMEDAQSSGGKFVLISENLPYDAAIYQQADSIVLAYLGSGLGIDPTDKTGDGSTAINANIIAAIDTVFGANSPVGTLPVNIPRVEENPDGTLYYGTEFIYTRGTGLSY